MDILKVSQLRKSYSKGFIPKKQLVLNDLNFSIKSGTITGFLGGNGAGKTTTMKCILGLAFPDSGEVKYFGDSPLSLEVKSKIGFLPERPYFYDYLTGTEFLKFYGKISIKCKASELSARILELLKKVDLVHAKDKYLRDYSKGMLQKIGFAQALIHNPEFVILDEPMSGLDPDGRYYLSELIKETVKEGKAVFLSSHLLHDVEMLCDELLVLSNGVVKFSGSTSSFLESMDKKIELKYKKDNSIEAVTLSSSADLQKEIDKLRGSNFDIIEITENKMSLEKAFVDIALKKEGEI